MGRIWSSYYGNWRCCHLFLFPQFMMDLLGLLSAEQLAEASVLLLLFNKIDLPCYMSTEEMKLLIRPPDVIACAKQNITMAEISACEGTGLAGVLAWLQATHRANG
uniref:Uncharacterized protein n=1 Tax=Pongo abelii TaxID=9601 RepID=H2NV22_PONAB